MAQTSSLDRGGAVSAGGETSEGMGDVETAEGTGDLETVDVEEDGGGVLLVLRWTTQLARTSEATLVMAIIVEERIGGHHPLIVVFVISG